MYSAAFQLVTRLSLKLYFRHTQSKHWSVFLAKRTQNDSQSRTAGKGRGDRCLSVWSRHRSTLHNTEDAVAHPPTLTVPAVHHRHFHPMAWWAFIKQKVRVTKYYIKSWLRSDSFRPNHIEFSSSQFISIFEGLPMETERWSNTWKSRIHHEILKHNFGRCRKSPTPPPI
jgi:hypothetical protein